jgi:hypothetical protein
MNSFKAFTNANSCLSIKLYLSSASRRARLKKAMDCSYPSLFFCNRTVAIVSSEEKEKVRKSFE